MNCAGTLSAARRNDEAIAFNHGMDAMTSFRYRCTRNDNFKGLKDLKPLQLPLVYTTVVPKGECQPDLTARIPR
ncbi:MAG: hypothetical protein HC773_19185 [Scytonema sp. CRU_2_7]|nr:hypothetical protein [Scytonema sp. CRU_2_7]